ncbi:Tetratricopeptide repeat-containing protein [Chitinophaga sp. YR573]|uniref:tetratricopeptide repeat protein n=1 Tax=Chitinophaga sp. YR573 TaxID=1881040 RepID=UPI0008C47B6E|nr:tetratricopeptide repeat protein [Chitinophaga sp. YR573]SEW45565.1 Tetratricopeptide repeat-containing protein [Chitinophaga sp. YR573]
MEGNKDKTWYLLEDAQLFSKSLLWDLQHQYFNEKGVDAWREGEVPHYITSNPTIANSYAEIIFSFLQDQHFITDDEPLYICELGAGTGRFAFHFLKRLLLLCEQNGIASTSFCYILTDFTSANTAFWLAHPYFSEYFAKGLSDVAIWDVNQSEQLYLHFSKKNISVSTLIRPLAVIANYVFDSVPQELYYIDDKRQWSQCLLSLITDKDPKEMNAAETLASLQYNYQYRSIEQVPHEEPYLQRITDNYKRQLTNTHILFPTAGLHCLHRMRALSKEGILLLSADKGDPSFTALENKQLPRITYHGSFSLSVNYHSFKTYCEQNGGIALFPEDKAASVNVNCLLLLNEPDKYLSTKRAYQREVFDFGPDDFYTIISHQYQYIDNMELQQILAYLRFSYYDSRLFLYFLPRLITLAEKWDDNERNMLIKAIAKVWDSHFPLFDTTDLADQLAGLLYHMNAYEASLIYYNHSMAIFGENAGTLYNIALCYYMLEQDNEAITLLKKVIEMDPENTEAMDMLKSTFNM